MDSLLLLGPTIDYQVSNFGDASFKSFVLFTRLHDSGWIGGNLHISKLYSSLQGNQTSVVHFSKEEFSNKLFNHKQLQVIITLALIDI